MRGAVRPRNVRVEPPCRQDKALRRVREDDAVVHLGDAPMMEYVATGGERPHERDEVSSGGWTSRGTQVLITAKRHPRPAVQRLAEIISGEAEQHSPSSSRPCLHRSGGLASPSLSTAAAFPALGLGRRTGKAHGHALPIFLDEDILQEQRRPREEGRIGSRSRHRNAVHCEVR